MAGESQNESNEYGLLECHITSLKREAAEFFETSVSTCYTTLRHIPQGSDLNIQRRQNLK
jgi:hypothetical protein